MPIYFYSVREEPYGGFSNFSPHGFEHQGLWWPTSEHFFQAQKFVADPGTAPWAEHIRTARKPKDAANMGRDRKYRLRPDWEAIKDDLMRLAVRLKFEAHADLRELLLATGSEPIVENAPGDFYWGCGADGSGKNMLGIILVETRELLSDRPSRSAIESRPSPSGSA